MAGRALFGENYLMAWPVEDLIQSNKDYRVDKAAPGLFLFGPSGGGEASRSTPGLPPGRSSPFHLLS